MNQLTRNRIVLVFLMFGFPLLLLAAADAVGRVTGNDRAAVLVVLLGLAALFYLLPALHAFLRHHRQRQAIAALNLLAGWTVVGWIAAMVWACTSNLETAAGA